VYGIDYRLPPEFKFPTQLDEYDAVIDALQGDFGKARGVHPDRVCVAVGTRRAGIRRLLSRCVDVMRGRNHSLVRYVTWLFLKVK
jgi:hypothetical protein